MIEEKIKYETAILAANKGFNEIQKYCYDPLCLEPNNLYNWFEEYNCSTKERIRRLISAPTQAFLQKWLRDEHKLHICVFITPTGFCYSLFCISQSEPNYKTYEDALEDGLKCALENIKNLNTNAE